MSINHETRHVEFEVSQANDGLLERCGQILGRQQSRVIPLLSGHFEDESELNAALNELWADAQTTAIEEEVEPLLDEVRQCSLAAKEAIKLHTIHELGLPDQDKLDEFERALM